LRATLPTLTAQVSDQLNRFSIIPNYDPIVLQVTALFRDTRAIEGTVFSRQEVIRFFGIWLDRLIAAQMV
jgi:hypothetical protein